MTNKSKKAQISYFIVAAVILILGMGTYYYVKNSQSSRNMAQQQKNLMIDQQKIQVIKNYAGSCFDLSLESSLIELGLQGGFFLQKQKGSTITWEQATIEFMDSETRIVSNVSYLLVRKGYDIYPENLPTNPYPCGSCMGTGIGTEPNYCGYDAAKGYTCTFGKKLLPPLKEGPFSLERQLQNKVENATKECLELNTLQALMGESFSATIEQITVNLSINDMSVDAVAIMPVFVFTPSGQSALNSTFELAASKSTRLKTIYEAMTNPETGVLEQDYLNVSYDIFIDGNKDLARYSPPLSLKVYRNAKESDDVIILYDEIFPLRGKPYIFQFARQNRPPVLNYFDVSSTEYHLTGQEGGTLTITPSATDPDEDKITYEYKAWKGEYEEEPGRISIITKNIWKESAMYSATNKDANILLKEYDAGKHMTKLVATDGQLMDWQQINISIEAVPKDLIRFTKIFTTDANILSLEDPFELKINPDWIKTKTGCQFIWTIDTQSLPVTTDSCMVLPTKTRCPDSYAEATGMGLKIDMIKTGYTTLLGSGITIGINTPHTLKVQAICSGTTYTGIEQIRIVDCIPHKSYIPIYPLNKQDSGDSAINYNWLTDTLPYKDFQTEHSCCSADYLLITGSSVSVVKDSNMCGYISRDPNAIWPKQNSFPTSIPLLFNLPVGGLDAGKTYTREIKASCDVRGNMAGKIIEEWMDTGGCSRPSASEICQGNNYVSPGFRSCDTTTKKCVSADKILWTDCETKIRPSNWDIKTCDNGLLGSSVPKNYCCNGPGQWADPCIGVDPACIDDSRGINGRQCSATSADICFKKPALTPCRAGKCDANGNCVS